MKLHINGEERAFADPVLPVEFTLTTLIESLNMKSDRVAVELNHEIAPRDRWPETILKDGDRLEIVHFVGGGLDSQGSHGRGRFERARL
jgi:sulfur carrier protein